MATAAVTANSLKGQVDQLVNQFLKVAQTAATFEVHQSRSTDLLWDALGKVYDFGEMIIALPDASGIRIVDAFLEEQGKLNARTRANPYIALVQLAFRASDSSHSQYSTVLDFARAKATPIGGFKTWLKTYGSIEKARAAAVSAKSTIATQNRNQSRLNRIDQARDEFKLRPASSAVALPSGVEAPEGFAIVLARVDSLNNASIIEVIETGEQVDPVLLRLADAAPDAPSSAIGRLQLAVDFVLSTTPDNPAPQHDRDILVCNTDVQGSSVMTVEAISTAYSFPAAIVTLLTHVGDLPANERFVLKAQDARRFVQQYDQHAGWTLNEAGVLSADQLSHPIVLVPLPTDHQYREADYAKPTGKHLKTTQEEFRKIEAFVDQTRTDNAKANKTRRSKRDYPSMLSLELDGSSVSLSVAVSALRAALGTTNANSLSDELTVSVSDLHQVAATFSRLGLEVDGWFMDGQVDDAAIVMDSSLHGDYVRVLIPTLAGSNYQQVTKVLL